MALEKILVVNDDAPDIEALKARLPPCIEVIGMSQFQARNAPAQDIGLIVLDNDANSRNPSKGAMTLPHLRDAHPDIPILYTSFQPGWVPAEVFQTRGVQVVRTDLLPQALQKEAGIDLLPAVAKLEGIPQTNLLITYNKVAGHKPGIFRNGQVVIVSYDKQAREQARSVVKAQMESIYKDFDFRRDRELIRNIFVYDGINGGDMPGQLAQSLGHDARMTVHLLACGCDWGRKERFLRSNRVDLHRVGCGGNEEMGAVADVLMGTEDADTKLYLPMPREQILGEAKRFSL